jgi:hypothetical protein
VDTKLAILCFIFLSALPAWGRPKIDVLVMKNGDRFTCEIKKLESGVLYVGLDYVDGTISVDWKKVARVESSQSFVVTTAGGEVYTGAIKTTETPAEAPLKLEIVEADNKEVTLERSNVAEVSQISERFWHRFSGNLTSGLIFNRGNNTAQYNLSSQLAYKRPRWEVQTKFTSAISASEGAATLPRNELSVDALKLLRRSNWYYSGVGTFLQSSQQGIQLQTTLGGGIGRFLKNTNRVRISLLGGFAYQETSYEASSAPVGQQKLVAGLIGGSVQAFQFKKTKLNLTAVLLPSISQSGRVRFNTNETYSIQIINNLWWTFTFYGNWDNRPPAGFSGSDYGASSGLTYSFN